MKEITHGLLEDIGKQALVLSRVAMVNGYKLDIPDNLYNELQIGVNSLLQIEHLYTVKLKFHDDSRDSLDIHEDEWYRRK